MINLFKNLNFIIEKGESIKDLTPFSYWCGVYLLLGLTSFLSWNYLGLLFIINIVSLFYILDNCFKVYTSFNTYIIKIFLFLISWHFGALSWMFAIDLGLYGLIGNMILYIIPFIIFYFLRKADKIAVFGIVPILLLFEFLLNNISFSFPWLTLGNLFSNQTYLVQWYEFTGVMGGSLWILLLSYHIWKNPKSKTQKYYIIFFFAIPIIFSLYIKNHIEGLKSIDTKIKVLTFNMEKRNMVSNGGELAYGIFNEAKEFENINAFLIPEYTFRGIDEVTFFKNPIHIYLQKIINESCVEILFVGSSTIKKDNTITNSGIVMSSLDNTVSIKVKKRLVPLTEYLPKFLKKIIRKDTFEMNVDDDSKAIVEKLHFTPIICYEIFYSFFINEEISDSSIIYLISSEAFLNGSFYGKLQYNNICRLRAIEQRVPLVKASNYGNSIYFNNTGNIESVSDKVFNVFDIVYPTYKKTFYNLTGKWLSFIIINIIFIISFFINHD